MTTPELPEQAAVAVAGTATGTVLERRDELTARAGRVVRPWRPVCEHVVGLRAAVAPLRVLVR
ncbi:hypothetical protein [Actinomycetospora soli]|uniref:hypothetical protein n=1 Tax=Actinomycetospora soli TaxID=2893887 RepID=UPI001E2FA2AB|nr:hypothetical protein [Actinomycetospora soli]MCD2191536.1 hypothetical protein [Actinomycetospora soli]